MINIIVCDDNKNDLNKIRKSINKIMKSLKIDYKENVFMDYDESFMKIIDKKIPFKFYIETDKNGNPKKYPFWYRGRVYEITEETK